MVQSLSSSTAAQPADCSQPNQLSTILVDLNFQVSNLTTSLQNLTDRFDKEMANQKAQSELLLSRNQVELMRQLFAQKPTENFLARMYKKIGTGFNSFFPNFNSATTVELILLSTIAWAVIRMKYDGVEWRSLVAGMKTGMMDVLIDFEVEQRLLRHR